MKKISIFLIALCLISTSAYAAKSLFGVFDVRISKVSKIDSSPQAITQYTLLIKTNKPLTGNLGIMLFCEGYENSASNTSAMSKYSKTYVLKLENFTGEYKFKINNPIGKRAIDYISCGFKNNKNGGDVFMAKYNLGRTSGDVLANAQDGFYVDVEMDIPIIQNIDKIGKEYNAKHPISVTTLNK